MKNIHKNILQFFGYTKNYTSSDYDNVIMYGFYLGLHKKN
jgi:hypothetical protein